MPSTICHRRTSHKVAALLFAPRHRTQRTQSQFGSTTGPTSGAKTDFSGKDGSNSINLSSDTDEAKGNDWHGGGVPRENRSFHFDPSKLPDTIPGLERRELAARLEEHQRELAQKYQQSAADDLAKAIDLMRRAMPPEEFKRFLQDVEKAAAEGSKEAARISAMSPAQLYRYQRRQRRRQRVQLFAKTVMLFVSVFGCVFFLFFFFFFFH